MLETRYKALSAGKLSFQGFNWKNQGLKPNYFELRRSSGAKTKQLRISLAKRTRRWRVDLVARLDSCRDRSGPQIREWTASGGARRPKQGRVAGVARSRASGHSSTRALDLKPDGNTGILSRELLRPERQRWHGETRRGGPAR